MMVAEPDRKDPVNDRIEGVKGFLIDLDGVLYTGDRITNEAPETIRFLTENGYPFRCVSNTTRKSRHSIHRHLDSLGFTIPEEMIFTPAYAAAAFLRKTGKNEIFLLATGDVEKDFRHLNLQDPCSPPDWVIIGDAGDNITYGNMNKAFRHLMEGAELMALESDRYWMAVDGLSLSAGPFVKALEFATGKTAFLVGKPSIDFFHLALEDMGLPPGQVAMIGDDINTDIGGAFNAGMRGILVKTGKFRDDTLASAVIKPAFIIDRFSGIRDLLMGCRRKRSSNPEGV